MMNLFKAPPGKTGITGAPGGTLNAFIVHLPTEPELFGFRPKTARPGPTPDRPVTHFNLCGAASIGPCSGKPLYNDVWQFGSRTTGTPIFFGPSTTNGIVEGWFHNETLPYGPADVHYVVAARVESHTISITRLAEYSSLMYSDDEGRWIRGREVEIYVYRHNRASSYAYAVRQHASQIRQYYPDLYRLLAFGIIDIKSNVWGLSHQIWGTVSARSTIQEPMDGVITGANHGSGPSRDVLVKGLTDAAGIIKQQTPLVSSDDYGELALNAAQFARSLDINSIEFLRDIPQLLPSIRSVIDVVRKKPSLKNFSNAYLAWKYGVSMSYNDIGKLVSATRSIKKRTDYGQFVRSRSKSDPVRYRLNGRDFTSSVDLTIKIWYDPFEEGLLGAFSGLDSWGLLPTRKRVWELVPFSFVVDWFIDISDALDVIDHGTTSKLLRVFDVILGRQIISPSLSSKHLGFQANMSAFSFKYYTRRRRKTIPSPPYRINRPESAFNNFVEASALILSRGK